MDIGDIINSIGLAIDVVGVGVMVTGGISTSVVYFSRLRKGATFKELYTSFRHGIGRSILLGLEFLVAGDIIRTVAVRPTFQSVGVLSVIIGLRTFLSIMLQVEVEGTWPWNKKKQRVAARVRNLKQE